MQKQTTAVDNTHGHERKLNIKHGVKIKAQKCKKQNINLLLLHKNVEKLPEGLFLEKSQKTSVQ